MAVTSASRRAYRFAGCIPCLWITGHRLCPRPDSGSAAHRFPLAAESVPACGARHGHDRDRRDRLHSSLLDGTVLRHDLVDTFKVFSDAGFLPEMKAPAQGGPAE